MVHASGRSIFVGEQYWGVLVVWGFKPALSILTLFYVWL
jgi:hypothetical protein